VCRCSSLYESARAAVVVACAHWNYDDDQHTKDKNTIDVYIIYRMNVHTFFFQRLFAIDFSFPEDDDICLMYIFGAWRVLLSGRLRTLIEDRYWDCHSSLNVNTIYDDFIIYNKQFVITWDLLEARRVVIILFNRQKKKLSTWFRLNESRRTKVFTYLQSLSN
jgi:hypothetical protein